MKTKFKPAKKKAKKQRDFPKLMVCRGSNMIVLFTDDGIGTVVTKGVSHPVGYQGTIWEMSFFKDCKKGDSVTLTQE